MNKMGIAAVLCIAASIVSGCEKKGPLEKAGEKADETVRTIQNGGEKTPGDKIKDGADDVKSGVENAVREPKK